MAIVRSFGTWLRRRLAWSNSRQSWEERLGLLLVLVGGIVLWWGGRFLASGVQVASWGVLLVAAAVLARRGWLKLFGPVLFYDMIRAARRGRYILFRTIYAVFLLLFLLSVWGNLSVYRVHSHREAAYMAEEFFTSFMLMQIVIVAALTPAYVAGSIAEEKEKKTLEYMLATDLHNREIVLSKFVSRLANVSLFVLTGLPVLSLIQFLGGVDPNLVLAGFVVTAMTMLGLGALSILNSVNCKRPRDAIVLTYLMAFAYFVIGLFLMGSSREPWMDKPIWFGDDPPTVRQAAALFNQGNVFVGMREFSRQHRRGGQVIDTMWTLTGTYAVFHGLAAALCVTLAVRRLRAVALRQSYGNARRTKRLLSRRPRVGDQPMLWKELNVEGGLRFSLLGAVILALLVLLSFWPALAILHSALFVRFSFSYVGQELNQWVRIVGTMVGCLLLLGTAIRAAGAISGERDKQTWDGILTSPLDGHSILLAKWLGSILSVRLGWIWLVAMWMVAGAFGGVSILALPLWIAAFAVYSGVLSMLGLWFSLTCKTTLRATMWTAFWTFILGGGHLLIWACCGPMLFRSGDGRAAEFLLTAQGCATPPAGMFFLSFSGEDFVYLDSGGKYIAYTLFGVIAWAVAGNLFWFGVLSPTFRAMTNRDETARKLR
jgi:ABC-type transport system involved in multi-copper enzyme maturation permease subunit